ncbi:hypothetical protein DPMN_028383 [Dreissena polymorpha]|uniref:Uncharacterized protein n=1 Tax=Dreissena polymorpha TaxID=45954 RepID=A0A9D4LX24_DREPO|nr:hypothetical protein DPMN_028383 [Dreissena polymorpha]
MTGDYFCCFLFTENRASLNKSLSVGFKIDLTRIAPSACIQPMHPRLTPEDAAKEDKTNGPTKRKRHRSVPSKAQEDVANKDEPTKKRHRSDMNVGQSSDPLGTLLIDSHTVKY